MTVKIIFPIELLQMSNSVKLVDYAAQRELKERVVDRDQL